MDYEIEELIPVVGDLTDKYTSKESSSITYEKAQQLMGAVIYCIGELKNVESLTDIKVKKIPAQRAYELGYDKVTTKVKAAMELYNNISENFDAYGNICLQDTILKGIPEFFKWYDAKYNPQDTILTLDYPLLIDIRKYQGIDEIYIYLNYISLEQQFLGKIDRKYIINILSNYNAKYTDMIENICEIVFSSVICHELIKKNLGEDRFTHTQLCALKTIFESASQKELLQRIDSFTESFIKKYYNSNIKLLKYLKNSTNDILLRLNLIFTNITIE